MTGSNPASPKKAKKPKGAKTPRSGVPAPRPALSRAVDADVHPVTGRVPLAQTSGSSSTRGFKPTRGGPTTSDALLGNASDKLVDLGVRVPKSLRKRLRQQAKARRVSVDELTAAIIAAARAGQ